MPILRLTTKTLWLLTLLAIGGFFLLGLVRTGGMLNLPYQAEYGEGPVLDWARQIARGQLPYKAIDTLPYNFSVYTPLYLAVAGLTTYFTPDNLWFGGRVLSLASALGLGWLLLRLTRVPALVAPAAEPKVLDYTFRGVYREAWLGVVLWLVSPYAFRWATYYRPDMFALWWSGLGMLLIHLAVRRNRVGWLAWAALCFVLAFFTKQSFFAAPLAAVLYLAIVRREWAVRLVLVGAWFGAMAGAFLYILAEPALLDNLIAANANPFSWQALWRFEQSFAMIALVVIGLAGMTAWQRQYRLLGLYGLVAMVVTLSVGKAGAWENYFLEPLWVACTLAGATLRDWQITPRRPLLALMVPLLVLAQLGLYTRGYERLSVSAEQAWLEETRQEGAKLWAAVLAVPATIPIWSEHIGVLAETGRPVLLHSFVYHQLAQQGLFKERELIAALHQQPGMLIQDQQAVNDPLRRDRWSRALLDEIEATYALGSSAGGWLVRPAQPLHPPLS